jgi:hypothetical protein
MFFGPLHIDRIEGWDETGDSVFTIFRATDLKFLKCLRNFSLIQKQNNISEKKYFTQTKLRGIKNFVINLDFERIESSHAKPRPCET